MCVCFFASEVFQRSVAVPAGDTGSLPPCLQPSGESGVCGG